MDEVDEAGKKKERGKEKTHWTAVITFPDTVSFRPTGLQPAATDTNTWESLNFIEAEEPKRQ